jgi:hypothetical protein
LVVFVSKPLALACLVFCLAPTATWAQRLNVWLQIDYQHGQESVDQLDDADGAPLNENRFLIPRARLRLSEEWRYFELVAEGDFNTVRGPQVGARALEAAIVWPPHPEAPFPNFRFETARPPRPAPLPAPAPPPAAAPPPAPKPATAPPPDVPAAEAVASDGQPLESPPTVEAPAAASSAEPEQPVEPASAPTPTPAPPPAPPSLLERFPLRLRLGGGILRAPFGHAVYEEKFTERLFAAPPLVAQAFFPGEYDLGARLSASWRGLSLVLALQNGEPLGSGSFPAMDPNADKDWFGRVGARLEPASWLTIEAGGSGVWGTGFHPGTPATKDVLVWRDLNEDGIAQLSELQAIRGSAATPSQNYSRWGLGGDLRARFRLPLGELTLFGEIAHAQNLDRGLRPADPVLLGRPQRGFTVYGGFTQEILGRLLVGFRADHYASELDQSRLEGGSWVRANEPFTHFSFALAYCFGSSLPFGKGRLLADYTLRLDPLGRDAAGRPADLKNDLFTLRLQLEL